MGEWHDALIKQFIPVSNYNIKTGFDGCHFKRQLNEEVNFAAITNLISLSNSKGLILVKCNTWVFSKMYFESTLTSEVI